MAAKPNKQKECKACKKKFTPFNSLARVCSPRCAYEVVKSDNTKKLAKDVRIKEKLDRADIRKRKVALKSKSKWLAEAQIECNKYIRLSDTSGLCISCQMPPKKQNAGHYKSVAGEPALRFHPLNIHLQCEACNSWKSGNITEYRINLIKKIGIESVEWLEGPHEAQKLTIDDIQEIKQYYKDKVKQINATYTL